MKKVLGVIAVLFGASILVWVIYNLFTPTPEFRGHFRFGGIAFPIVMILVGVRWLMEK